MTIKTPSYEAKTHKIENYDFAAVGVVVPGATILHPSVAEYTDEMMATAEDAKTPFMLTHDGVLTEMHKFSNRYGIVGMNTENTALDKNMIVGIAIEKQLKAGTNFDVAFRNIVPSLEGAFSIMAKQEADLYVARDRYGFGTMFIGEIATGGYVVSSQEASINELGAPALFELEPGTLARIGANAIQCTRWAYPVHKTNN